MIHLHPFIDTASAAAAQAAALAERLRRLLAERAGSVVTALSGGRSPVAFFHALRDERLDWSRIELHLVDERLVAPDHPQSNERLLREHLLRSHAAGARFVGLVPAGWPTAPTPEQLTALVERANAWHAPIDVAVLGMGADGHTASLFADAPEYAGCVDLAADARYALLQPDPSRTDPAVARITLTLPALLAAHHWQLGLSGAAKRVRFERARDAHHSPKLPIGLLLANLPPGAEFDVYWHP